VSCLLGIVLAVGPSLRADVIILRNGDRISGEVIEQGPLKVSIETSYAGLIAISRGKISDVNVEDTVAAEALAVTSSESKQPNIDLSAKAVDWEGDKKRNEWEGSANLSMKLESGSSSDSNELDGDISLRWRRDQNRFRLRGQVEYDTVNGKGAKQDWLVVPQYDRFFTEKAYWSMMYSFKQEKYDGLKLRQAVGPSLGYEFFSDEKHELISEIGIFYVDEQYINGLTDNYMAPGWSLDYRRKLMNDRLELYHSHFSFLRGDNMSQKIWHSWTGFKIPLHGGIYMAPELELDFDNVTLNRSSSLDHTVRLKFGYDW
tara:strand:- start:592 stop:1539 length:948 start_codon:yes stop_codon:yes gene_type:complete